MRNFQFLLIAFLDLVIGFYVYSKGAKRQVNQAFLALFMAAFGWVISLYFLSNSADYPLVLFLCKTAYISGMLVPVAMLNLVFCYPNKRLEHRKLLWIYSPGLAISLLSFTDLIVGDCVIYDWGVKVIPGKLYILSLVYFVAYLGLITHRIVREYRESDRYQKNQWVYLIFGLPIPILHVLITNLILPRLGFKDIYTLGPWASFEMVVVLGFAIYKYHLFNMEVVLRKAAVNVFLIVVFACLVYLMTSGVEWVFGDLGRNRQLIVLSILTVAILTYRPVHEILQKSFEYFYPSADQAIMKLFEETLNLNELFKNLGECLRQLAEHIISALHYETIAIYLLDEKTRIFQCFVQRGHDMPARENLELDNPAVQWLRRNKNHLDVDEFKHEYGHLFLYTPDQPEDPEKQAVYRELGTLKTKLAYPINLNDSLIGVILVGPKRDASLITPQELALFKALSNQLGIAYLNHRINQQNISTDRIKLVGTMSANLAHEIKNPMTSIRALVEMLPTTSRKQEVLQKISEIIPNEIDRITKIINDLLDFSRANVCDKKLHLLSVLIYDIVFIMDNEIHKRHLQVTLDIDDTIHVYADRNELKQVLINILLNACQASRAGGKITIRAYEKDGQVWISICDEGEGIKSKDLEMIFEPFYSTKVNGTGLGLPTSRRIIDAHGGKILVESKEGHGSAFTVVIPSQAES